MAAVGNVLAVAVPVVIGLGILAGIGVVVRVSGPEGLERKQLSWRAAGVGYALLLFPLAVTNRLPDWAADLDPLVFVVTLVVPVLRYDLWAIDTVIRRSAAYTMTSPRSVVENMVAVAAEMLRLPYVAVRRGGGCSPSAVTGRPRRGVAPGARRPASARWSLRRGPATPPSTSRIGRCWPPWPS